MTPGRRAANLRRNRSEAGKSLGDDPVAVRLKHFRGDVQALRQRDDAASGLLPHECIELAKGAQENEPQHPDARSSSLCGVDRARVVRGPRLVAHRQRAAARELRHLGVQRGRVGGIVNALEDGSRRCSQPRGGDACWGRLPCGLYRLWRSGPARAIRHLRAKRLIQRSFRRPAARQTAMKLDERESFLACPHRERLPLPLPFENHGVGGVISLDNWRRPPAVAGLITFRAVDPVQGRTVWTLAHVGEEVLEYRPALTNCDSGAAVLRIGVGVPVEAAHAHGAPRAVRPSAFHSCRVPMPRAIRSSLRRKLAAQASAGRGVAAPEIRDPDVGLVAAVATAMPRPVLPALRPAADDGQTPEALPDHAAILRAGCCGQGPRVLVTPWAPLSGEVRPRNYSAVPTGSPREPAAR